MKASREGSPSWRSVAVIEWSRDPSWRPGWCVWRGPGPASGCRGRRWRRWPSSPTSSRSRGVSSDAVLDGLLERRLVRIAGRKEAPGRPFLYETTREFLVAFGLRDLHDLPVVDGELVLPDLLPNAESADATEPGDGQAQ